MGRAHAVARFEIADDLDLEAERRARLASRTFAGWLEAACPMVGPDRARWDWPHLRLIREHLDRVTAGEIRRLIITIPPQYGKSSLATIRYPVWRIIRDPRLPVILGSYNEDKAAEFATKARKVAAGWVSFSPDVNRAAEWQTTAGGGIVSVGPTGGTGRAARLFIVDDPFKDPQAAESFATREQVWRWYSQVVNTRRPEAIVLIATRWHEDDLTGRLLKLNEHPDLPSAEKFVHIHLRAVATESDPLGRAPGEPLCAEVQTAEQLRAWSIIDPFGFATMGQGDTAPREGSAFELAKLLEVPASEVPEGLAKIRAWDLATSRSPDADETVGILLAGPSRDGIRYVLDAVAGRWEPAERNARILETARADGYDVQIWGPEDPLHGHETALAFVRMLEGFQVATSPVLKREGEARPHSKMMRAEGWRSAVNGGLVRLVSGAPWIGMFLDQHRRFPRGHNDYVDAAALAYTASLSARAPGDYGAF